MKKYIALLSLIAMCLNYSLIPVVFAQHADTIVINATVFPSPATNFQSTTGYNPGAGECELTWITSPTPNIINQRLDMDEYPFTSIDSSLDLPFPGPSIGDSIVISGLVVGWTYYFELISEGNTNSSTAVSTYCTPASALPAPVMVAEPATTVGTSNTVSWTNGLAVDNATLECRVGASKSTLSSLPFTYVDQSGWTPCPASGTTYSHTFNGLTLDTTYFYHVQSRTPVDGLSPFSNVVFSTQISAGGGTTPPSGGGGDAGGSAGVVIPGTPDEEEPIHEAPEEQECGNGVVETGEECDDGNYINGDGCNSACMLEPSAACGNGVLEDPEQCDDGNNIDGDGCSSTCALEIVKVKFEIKGAPEFRVLNATNPNLSLNSQFLVYKPVISNLDSVRIKLDDFGNATYEGFIVTGTYDFGLNGEAHNTKLIRGIQITPETEVVTLDFTYVNTVKLTAGDTVDDNYINGVDMSKLIQQYRLEGAEVLSDLNREGYVNGIDASIVITNYRKEGEKF